MDMVDIVLGKNYIRAVCHFRLGWRGVVLPLGLLLEASVITAFIFAYWNIDPLLILKIGQIAAGGAG